MALMCYIENMTHDKKKLDERCHKKMEPDVDYSQTTRSVPILSS